ncbi:histone deacetylase 6-like [Strigops habroptila]|uniref:histone deacetylase 6-like n=1 Tax=Strigops habroptila TaxID=2489341 RepID=UPI0014033F35|nr:histone deacetylase 6-like [Strigops habroptila]
MGRSGMQWGAVGCSGAQWGDAVVAVRGRRGAHVSLLARTAALPARDLRAVAARFDSVFLSPRSYECARLAAGTACAAVSAVLRAQVRNAVAIVRPPGHHAGPGAAGGFCLFNNVAVAAQHGQSLAGGALRVLILDWDVHHGNGTQKIFEEDPSVLYISLHRHDGSFFPGGSGGSPRRRGRGRGTGFTINVGWGGPRAGDPEYLLAMTRLVLPVACQFSPQLVLVSAGFDAGRGDPLGGCLVSPPTFGLMTHLLGGLAGGRLVLVLEGGYNLGATAEGMGQCLGVLLGTPPVLPPPRHPPTRGAAGPGAEPPPAAGVELPPPAPRRSPRSPPPRQQRAAMTSHAATMTSPAATMTSPAVAMTSRAAVMTSQPRPWTPSCAWRSCTSGTPRGGRSLLQAPPPWEGRARGPPPPPARRRRSPRRGRCSP